MRLPLIFFGLSFTAFVFLYLSGGRVLTLPLLIAALLSFLALFLLLSAIFRPAPRLRTGPQVVIDGSNVMHWNGEVARLETLREVVAALRAKGCEPGVVFDANAGYKLKDRYLDDRHFAKLLQLPKDRVLVVPKGEPADPTILAAARDLNAKVITNDRFRDWVDDFPEVKRPGHLVRGGFRNGRLWLAEGALATPP